MAKIYNKSLESGIFPSKSKVAYITPIHGGNARDVTKCRPISLLSNCGKMLKSVINKNMLCHIHKYVKCSQPGFLPGRSWRNSTSRTASLHKRGNANN